ncbi:hypothetical protein [Bradyrhizobium sp. WSM4349]
MDRRSLADQGIDREAQLHVGPARSTTANDTRKLIPRASCTASHGFWP